MESPGTAGQWFVNLVGKIKGGRTRNKDAQRRKIVVQDFQVDADFGNALGLIDKNIIKPGNKKAKFSKSLEEKTSACGLKSALTCNTFLPFN